MAERDADAPSAIVPATPERNAGGVIMVRDGMIVFEGRTPTRCAHRRIRTFKRS